MSAPSVLGYHDNGDQITDADPLILSAVAGSSAEVEIDLVNNRGGFAAETAYAPRLMVGARSIGSVGDFSTVDRQIMDDRLIKVRIISGFNGLAVTPTSQVPMGAGSELQLPDLPNGQGVRLGVQLVPDPLKTGDDECDVLFKLRGASGYPIGPGITESCGVDGVRSGLADAYFSGLFRCSAVVEDPGGASEFVQVQETSGVLAGVPAADVQQLIELDQDDGATPTPATLATGQEYLARITFGPDGFETAKSELGASPLDPATDAPDVPEGHLPVALVRVGYDAGGGNITTSDITQEWALKSYEVSFDALNATASAGEARMDNTLVLNTYPSTAVLADDTAGQSVYLLRNRTLSTTSGPRSLLLRSGITTAAGAVTVQGTDQRDLIGHSEHVFRFAFDATLAAAQVAYGGANLFRRPLYVLPIFGVVAILRNLGSGNTTGEVVVDLQKSTDHGATWVTLFTSSGSRDMRPRFAHDGTSSRMMAADDATQEPFPEVRIIEAGALLRATIATETLDGTAPGGLDVLLRCAQS